MSLRKAFKRIGKGIARSAKHVGQKIEKYGGAMIGQNFSRQKSSGSDGTNQGPQFTDEARRAAAGAGTVGFTQRTQNY